MSSKVFTSILSEDLMLWLDNFSKKNKKGKRSIIEKAPTELRDKLKKKEMEKAFSSLNKDQEMSDLAELGLDDFLGQIKDYKAQ